MSHRRRSSQWSSGLLRWARRGATRHPSAGPARRKQITVFIYIIIASCRTLLFYYCRRQGHRAMIHGRQPSNPRSRVTVGVGVRSQTHPWFMCVRCRAHGGTEPGINYSLLPLAYRDFFIYFFILGRMKGAEPLCVCCGGACAKNVTFASTHQKTHTQKKQTQRQVSLPWRTF